MGGAISQLSREEVQKKSQEFTRIYSYIFDFMIKELNLADVLQLNSTDYCKRYIMFMGDALYQFFQKIQLDPRKSDKGTIYFKKTEDMIPKGSAMEQQKISFCRQIAFFYLRLFQIYSALALSVIDQANIITSDPRFKLQPQIPGARPTIPRQFGGIGQGDPIKQFWGRISRTNDILDTSTIKDGMDYRYLKNTSNPSIFLKQSKFYLEFNNRNYKGDYNITLADNFIFSVTNIQRKNSRGSFDGPRELPTLQQFRTDFSRSKTLNINNLASDLEDYFRKGLEAIENRISQRPRGDEPRRDAYTSSSSFSSSSTSIPTDVRTLLEPFKPMRTQPYCMARALQLLRQETLQSATSKVAYTSVCATKFEEAGKGIVPVRDGLISESLGLKALSGLFFDTLESATPKLSTNSIGLYKNFLANLEILFEDRKSSSSDPLGGIRSKSPKGCSDKRILGVAKIEDPQVINNTKAIIMKLYQIQVQHAASAQRIINKLFEVTPRGIYLTTAVTEGGIPYLNFIAAEARELLMKYYEQCEGYYALGAYEMFSPQAKIESGI